MSKTKDHSKAPDRRWAVWLGALLLVPLGLASAAMLYFVFRIVATGQLTTVAKSYRTSSTTIQFAESPLLFLFYLALTVGVAGGVVLLTVVLARLVLQRLRARS